MEFLDKNGLISVWAKIKEYIENKLGTTNYTFNVSSIKYEHVESNTNYGIFPKSMNININTMADIDTSLIKLVVLKNTGSSMLDRTTKAKHNTKVWSILNVSKRPTPFQKTTFRAASGKQDETRFDLVKHENRSGKVYYTIELDKLYSLLKRCVYTNIKGSSLNNIYLRIGRRRKLFGRAINATFITNTTTKNNNFKLGIALYDSSIDKIVSDIVPIILNFKYKKTYNIPIGAVDSLFKSANFTIRVI